MNETKETEADKKEKIPEGRLEGQQNPKSGEVWLCLRTIGTRDVHELRLPSKQANRILRKLNHKAKKGFSHLDYLQIRGIYEPVLDLKEGLKTLKAGIETKKRLDAAVELDRVSEILGNKLQATRTRFKASRIRTTLMSFQLGKMDQAVLVFCPHTGIVGKLEMPFVPVAFEYEHPLSRAANVLKLLRWYFAPIGSKLDTQYEYVRKTGATKLDRQTLAGCLLTLLKAKDLLRDSIGDSSAAEKNLTLQNAGINTLVDILKEIVGRWDNPAVWRRMPQLNVAWNSHASSESTIGASLQQYLKVLRGTLEPLEFSSDEQAKIFNATRIKPRNRIKVYSAAAVETRKIKEAKFEGNDLFEQIKDRLNIAQRITIQRTLKNLLLWPDEVKAKTALMLESLEGPFDLRAKASALASVILHATNESLLKDVGSFTQEVSPIKAKSIAEILKAKRLKAQEKQSKEENNDKASHEGKEESNGN